jgi:hypothetical protein
MSKLKLEIKINDEVCNKWTPLRTQISIHISLALYSAISEHNVSS